MKIIVIEGLMGEVGGWARTPLIRAGLEVTWYPWWWNPTIPDGCILFGHSLGGGKAIRLAKKSNPKLLVTADPRLEPEGGFVAPTGFHTRNFYQTGFMQGFPVKGALNIKVNGLRHTQVPLAAVEFIVEQAKK